MNPLPATSGMLIREKGKTTVIFEITIVKIEIT